MNTANSGLSGIQNVLGRKCFAWQPYQFSLNNCENGLKDYGGVEWNPPNKGVNLCCTF